MNKKNIHLLTQAAMIAALYVVLTFVANAFGLANYAVQVRFSEALTILPLFTPAGIPGLFIGCLISNILTGCALPDIIFGSIATLIGALGTWKLRNICSPFPDKNEIDASQGRSSHEAAVGEAFQRKASPRTTFQRNVVRRNVFLAPLPPILANTIIVPFVLRYAYDIRPLWLSFLTVGAGEIISCGILGLLLACTLNKYRSQIFREDF